MDETKGHIWIIGASSGIGRALVCLYAEQGSTVTVSARSETSLEDLAENYDHVTALPLDVGEDGCFAKALRFFDQQGGLPDQIIYCAATYIPGGLSVLTRIDARRHMEINYAGFAGLVEVITPRFQERGSGQLVAIASLSGYCGLPNAALYGPTKAALINLCETLRPDFEALGLDLRLVNPGFVKTPMTDKNSFAMPFLLSPGEAARLIAKGLAGRAFEIHFPWQLSIGLKLLQKLPYGLYFHLTKRLGR